MMVFLLLLIMEAVLAACRMKTASIHRKTTVILRVISILALSAFFVLSVLEWGFRYYALAAVLIVSAAVSIAGLFRKKECGRLHAIWRLAGMSALLFAASLPAIVFPEYKPFPTTGGYPVKTAVKHFADKNRIETYGNEGGPRTLALEFWYPGQAKGTYPLVVFSHGSFGIRSSNETLFRELASHGYVVCSIDHSYHCFYTELENRKTVWMDSGYANEIRIENAKEDKPKSLELYRKWMGVRVTDIHFVIDTVLSKAEENPADAVYRLVDPKKIGVIGHSLGGAAALGIGRQRSDVGAVIAMEAPFLCDITAVENGSFVFDESEYPAPVLNIYSDSSWTHLDAWPQYAQNARLLSGADADAYNLHIEGAGHLSLTDLSLSSPVLTRILNGHKTSAGVEECLRTINQACRSFFDGFLKGTVDFEHAHAKSVLRADPSAAKRILHSAPSPLFAESEKALAILPEDILKGTNLLSG